MNADILKEPTEHLRQLLNRLDENGLRVDRDVYLLHRHIVAGGTLPAQWREEGTAVGRMVRDERLNLDFFRFTAMCADTKTAADDYRNNAKETAEAIRAVTGEG